MKAPTDTGLRRRVVGGSHEEFVFDIRTGSKEQPLLHVDINLPNKNVRVALYKSSDANQVAGNFVKKYGLEASMVETLTQTLQEHMQKAMEQ